MRLVFWLLLAALLIYAWQNPDKVRSYYADGSKWVGEKSRVLADKWAPLPPPKKEEDETYSASAVSSLPELPEGMFVLKESVTVATGAGTVIWQQGATVRKLGEGAGKALVSDGTNQTTLDLNLLTRDPAERAELARKTQATTALKTKANAQALEAELAQVEAKISSLQAELRQVAATRTQLGRAPFGTNEEFLKLSIKRQEERKQEIYKLLGRSAPRMVLSR